MKRYDYMYGRLMHPTMSITKMTEHIIYEADVINIGTWLDDVPSRDRDMCVRIANQVFKDFEATKATPANLNKFIRALHEAIKKEIQSRGN